ncbi:MAG: cytochrome c [Xanthomonadales bacterium]|nr:cytochrome c [Xanthomonadales bacterium]
MSRSLIKHCALRAAAVALFGVVLSSSALAAGNAGEGQRKSQPCQACHGVDGNGIGDPQYPNLAGQYQDYLYHALKSYKDGSRENLIMAGFVATLTDQDMQDLAAYFSAQNGKLHDLSHMEN